MPALAHSPTPPTVGIYCGMPADEYRRARGLSCSTFNGPTPAHWRLPSKPATAAMRLGTLAHCAVLEPEELDKRYYRLPSGLRFDSRTTAFKAAQEAAGDREIVKPEEYDEALRLRDAVAANATAAQLLSGTADCAEVSAFAQDPETSLLMKCRPDWINPALGVLIDLKTAITAEPKEWGRKAAGLEYHFREAWYRQCWQMAGGFDVAGFVFVVVEKESAFVALYELPPEAIQAGERIMRQRLDTYSVCQVTGQWPGYSDLIETITWPTWAF